MNSNYFKVETLRNHLARVSNRGSNIATQAEERGRRHAARMRASQGTQANLDSTQTETPVEFPTVPTEPTQEPTATTDESRSESAGRSGANLGTLGSGSLSASADLQTLLAGVHRRLFQTESPDQNQSRDPE